MSIQVKNIIGEFVFDDNFNLVEEKLFQSKEDVLKYIQEENNKTDYRKHDKILTFFNQQKYLDLLKNNNTIVTRYKISKSVTKESLVIQAISMLNELDPILNRLAKKVREWYSLYNPEFEHATANNDGFIRIITQKSKEELLSELKIEQTMGGDISDREKDFMLETVEDINIMFERREKIVDYIKEEAEKILPNTAAIIGGVMATRMLAMAGSLERLSKLPSSTVQLLGAESALFKHIKTGSRCPKYGYLINHPLVQKAPKRLKGKTARAIADKVAIAAKVDYFKGEPIGEKFRLQLEKRFG